MHGQSARLALLLTDRDCIIVRGLVRVPGSSQKIFADSPSSNRADIGMSFKASRPEKPERAAISISVMACSLPVSKVGRRSERCYDILEKKSVPLIRWT